MSRKVHHLLNATASGLIPLVALATAPMLARGLGPEDRGYFASDQSMVLTFSALLALGISDMSASYWVRWLPTSRRWVQIINFSGALALGTVCFFLLGSEREPSVGLLIIAGILILSTANLSRGVALAYSDILGTAIEKWITVLGRLGLTFSLFITDNLSVFSALSALVIPQIVGQIFLTLRNLKSAKSFKRTNISLEFRKWELLWAVLGGAGGVLLVNADSAVLLVIIGSRELGYYAVAVLVSEFFTVVAKPFRDAFFATPLDDIFKNIKRNMVCSILSLFGVAILMSTLIWWVIPTFFGASFQPAVIPAYVMLVGGIFKGFGYHVNGVLVRLGSSGYRAALTYAACLLAWILMVLLSDLGAVGAAFSMSAGYVLMASVGTILVAHAVRSNKILVIK